MEDEGSIIEDWEKRRPKSGLIRMKENITTAGKIIKPYAKEFIKPVVMPIRRALHSRPKKIKAGKHKHHGMAGKDLFRYRGIVR